MVVVINSFTVPAGREDEFMQLFEEVNSYLVTRPGYLGHQLHRSVDPGSRYNFVNYVIYESVEHVRNAHTDYSRALLRKPGWEGITSTPSLYDVVDRGGSLE